jgi:hypothetical protein
MFEQAGETHGANDQDARTGEAGLGGFVVFVATGRRSQSAARGRGVAQWPLCVLVMVSPSHYFSRLVPLAPFLSPSLPTLSIAPSVPIWPRTPASSSPTDPALPGYLHNALRFSLTLSPVITNIDDPKFDLEKLLEAWTQGA